MSIDLNKVGQQRDAINLIKQSKGIGDQKAQVVLVMDYSGSMDHLYSNGTVQDTVDRILPVGLSFDDNKEVDFYLFHHSYIKGNETIKIKTVDGFVKRAIKGHSMGSTNYAPVINAIVKEYTKTKGLFTGGKEVGTLDYPIFVMVIVDGGCDDEGNTNDAIKEASKYGIHFWFAGIGTNAFTYLRRLDDLKGRVLDNVSFMHIPDIKSLSDDALYNGMMAEFPEWVKQARAKQMIK